MFPAFLSLASRRVVVVGGGPVAAAKLDALIAAGADVTVVAPDVVPTIEERPVTILRRPFEERDLDGAWWVVAAATPEINARARAAADERRIFVNAVDDPQHATAYLGGVVRRHGVTVAISTDGRAPALAGLLREALEAWLPADLDEWLTAADAARRTWKEQQVPMEQRRPQLLEILNRIYLTPSSQLPTPNRVGVVSLVGAGPGDPELWTRRALRLIEDADLVLYDALVDAAALRARSRAQCFCVGKRARRDSVPQETIHRLMIRAARRGKHVVRLKGGDPFVFGRGGEEALALAKAGVPFEVVPGVTTAVAAPELAGIPLTHRGVASGFLVLAGHTVESVNRALESVQPNALSVVMMMGLDARSRLADQLMAHGWRSDTPAAIICDASTPREWTWIGRLDEMGGAAPPAGAAGVLVIGEVVRIQAALKNGVVKNGVGSRSSKTGTEGDGAALEE
ncbi:MAG: uroporphyrinogen-III C-methyltransferase [Acidobacteria bacterium RIFCSPLOWO2_12_FULL_67_14]|nr:MAG: uroporphyrinogen-III C-methyltransferase [Acidobacteria bacterium RIFCSPLOWO2_02_FULL_67_21]OFW37096.1 MAG: uroporphyrinogen-III C-methyltransferase [Acidobacteria bacterium RIFCSPLOWO2_12_FULL_67_14]